MVDAYLYVKWQNWVMKWESKKKPPTIARNPYLFTEGKVNQHIAIFGDNKGQYKFYPSMWSCLGESAIIVKQNKNMYPRKYLQPCASPNISIHIMLEVITLQSTNEWSFKEWTKSITAHLKAKWNLFDNKNCK